MKHTRHGFGVIVLMLMTWTLSAHAASLHTPSQSLAKARLPQKTKIAASYDLPAVLFQRVDKRLSALDIDDQYVGSKAKAVEEIRGRARRAKMLRQVQHSPQFRERLHSTNELLTIASRAERTYSARHQQYGARLFRDLHTKLAALKSPLREASSARTLTAFDRDEKLIQTRMLAVVVQFQAISGGYAGLACRPGTWACCGQRVIKDGKVAVRACTWSCAARLTACAGGCLGPLIPKTVIAVKNSVPSQNQKTLAHRRRAQQPTLAARREHKGEPASRAPAAAVRQGTAAGSE